MDHSPSSSPKRLINQGKPKRVLILGAGIAGLVSAYELTQAGHNVTLLEARLRPGGRILTLRSPFADDLYVEAGAARIPNTHHWTLNYLNHFGLQVAPFYPEKLNFVHYLRGKQIRVKSNTDIKLAQYPLDSTLAEREMELKAIAKQIFKPLLSEIGDPTTLDWPPEPLRAYDRLTVKEFIDQQALSPQVAGMFGFGYLDFSKTNVSVLEILRLMALGASDSQMLKVVGGADQLTNALAAPLKEKIHYGAEVVRIDGDRSQARVVYRQGGTTQTMAAEYLVCTLPFSVLRHINMTVPLSEGKKRAIRDMAYLSLSRVFLQVRRRYWLDQGLNGFGLADYPAELWHSTFDQPEQRAILVSYLKGMQSQHLMGMQEADRIEYVIGQLDPMLPGLRNYVEGGLSVCWDEDHWAQGGHVLLQAGQVTELLPHSAHPEGRIHFAGEHTSVWHGWVQGAIESGYRAALEINQLKCH